MGNDIGAPSLNLIKNSSLFPEYTASKLIDIRESHDFSKTSILTDKKITVDRAEFDEVQYIRIVIFL